MMALIAALAVDEEVQAVEDIPKTALAKRPSMTEETTPVAMAIADDRLRTVAPTVVKVSIQEVKLSVSRDVEVQVVPATTIITMKVVRTTAEVEVAIEKMESREKMVAIPAVSAEAVAVVVVVAVAVVVMEDLLSIRTAVEAETWEANSARTAVEAATWEENSARIVVDVAAARTAVDVAAVRTAVDVEAVRTAVDVATARTVVEVKTRTAVEVKTRTAVEVKTWEPAPTRASSDPIQLYQWTEKLRAQFH